MQYLLKDHVRRLRRAKKVDTVQITRSLLLPECKTKRSLPDMSPGRKEDPGIEARDRPKTKSSSETLHQMWSIPRLINLPIDEEKRPRRHMSKLRSGEMRSMRCYARTRRLCILGYFQVLRLHPHAAQYMLGLQGTAATCAKEKTTGTHAKEQAKVLHVQASASTHTDMPTPR